MLGVTGLDKVWGISFAYLDVTFCWSRYFVSAVRRDPIVSTSLMKSRDGQRAEIRKNGHQRKLK
jgi:hypothetical protein